MAASTWEQTWYAYRYSDNEIVLSGTVDASAYTLAFEIAESPTATPVLAVTPTVSTTTITIPLTYAQMTSTLTNTQYQAALWRLDSGSRKPLASGKIVLTIVPHAAT